MTYRVHDTDIKEIIAERNKREVARGIRLMILIGILWVLDIIAFLLPPD